MLCSLHPKWRVVQDLTVRGFFRRLFSSCFCISFIQPLLDLNQGILVTRSYAYIFVQWSILCGCLPLLHFCLTTLLPTPVPLYSIYWTGARLSQQNYVCVSLCVCVCVCVCVCASVCMCVCVYVCDLHHY